MPMQYTAVFTAVKMLTFKNTCYIFLIVALILDCEVFLMSTHNLCFRSKIMYTPVHPSFTMLKWGLRGLYLTGVLSYMLILPFQ